MTDRIKFSGPTLGSPEWCADFLSRDHLIPGGAKLDTAQFLGTDGAIVTVGANAAIAATGLTVGALAAAIPSGTTLYFNGGKSATLTAAAAAAATALVVSPLVKAIDNGDVAIYTGSGPKPVPSGTVIGRTLAERNAATGYGPAASGDDEVYLIAFDVTDAAVDNDCTLVRHGTVIKENFLPGFAGLAGAVVTFLRSYYAMQRGAE